MAGSTRAWRAVAFGAIGAVAAASLVALLVRIHGDYQAAIAAASAPEPTRLAVVAARDLHQGVVITEEDLALIEIPTSYANPAVYASPELVIGRTPRERVLANEFLREERLASADDGVGLNALVPRGMRALSLDLGDGAALSGLLTPKSAVDVLVTLRGDYPADRPETTTVVQAAYVLAVDARTSESRPEDEAPRARPSVTLAVTPEQAESVAHAARRGALSLTLRALDDVAAARVDGADTRAILGELPVVPAAVRRPPTPTPVTPVPMLTVIRGGQVELVPLR
jgi:pilus assembly protein CpaB